MAELLLKSLVMQTMAKQCQTCGKRAYSDFCLAHKPRTPIRVNVTKPKPRKPIQQQGKVAKSWIKTRADWFKANTMEFYTCYICNRMLRREDCTLDHIISRSSRPDLRYVHSNLAVSCWTCNNSKGSKSLEVYLQERQNG